MESLRCVRLPRAGIRRCRGRLRRLRYRRLPVLADKKQFRQWYRRGRDPEKLRKMVPSMRLSNYYEGAVDKTGGEILEFTRTLLYDTYATFLTEF